MLFRLQGGCRRRGVIRLGAKFELPGELVIQNWLLIRRGSEPNPQALVVEVNDALVSDSGFALTERQGRLWFGGSHHSGL